MKFSIVKMFSNLTLGQPFRFQRSNFPGVNDHISVLLFSWITLHLFMLQHRDYHHCVSLVETIRNKPNLTSKGQGQFLSSCQVKKGQTRSKWVSIDSDDSMDYNDYTCYPLASPNTKLYIEKSISPYTHNGRGKKLTWPYVTNIKIRDIRFEVLHKHMLTCGFHVNRSTTISVAGPQKSIFEVWHAP